MRNHLQRGAISIGIAFALLTLTPLAFPQDPSATNSNASNKKTAQKKDPSKKEGKEFSLSDVTRVSTEDAAKSAAHKAVSGKDNGSNREADAGADSVTEFNPAPPEATKVDKTDSKTSRKRSGPKIHGDAYGTTKTQSSGTNQAGGSVGATSKSGKTSVYVGGSKSQSSTTTPQ